MVSNTTLNLQLKIIWVNYINTFEFEFYSQTIETSKGSEHFINWLELNKVAILMVDERSKFKHLKTDHKERVELICHCLYKTLASSIFIFEKIK